MSSYRMADFQSRDSIGLPRFTVQQAKAMIDRVRQLGLLNTPPLECSGRGIIIIGGGKYLDWSYVLAARLREMGTQLPIQVYHLGAKEMPRWATEIFKKLDVETVDIFELLKKFPVKNMSGWVAKSYATMHCPFEEVMHIDADCCAAVLPEKIFDNPQVQEKGSLLFRDVGKHHPNSWGYQDFGLAPLDYEFETGQFIWHKKKAWHALRWTVWASEHTDVFYRRFHGDKGVIEVCFRSTNTPFVLGERSEWMGYGIDHYLDGEVVFQHTMGTKRHEHPLFEWQQRLFWQWQSLSLGKG